MLADAIEETGKILFRLIVEGLCFYTGEILLYVGTFGRHSPRWDIYANESPSRYVIMTEVSTWVGALFWMVVVGSIARWWLG